MHEALKGLLLRAAARRSAKSNNYRHPRETEDEDGNLIMFGAGQQHWSTVHAADLADFLRRVLEDDSARGRYVIGTGLNPTVADLIEAAAVAAGAAGAVLGSDDQARARLGLATRRLCDHGDRPRRATLEGAASTRLTGDRRTAWVLDASDEAVVSGPQVRAGQL